MITFIIGPTGAGKTAFAVYRLNKKYLNEGKQIFRNSCALIQQANEKYGRNLSMPDQVPFYTYNFHAKLHVGYKKYYEPYFLNGYYFGVANEDMDTQFVAPGSVLVFDEAQRIYNSRKSTTFSDWTSYAFEIHRKARLDITLIAQRGMLVDRNIKELGVHVIEILGMDNEYDAAGNVIRSTWRCREFESWQDAEQYLKTGEGKYTETTYTNEGNIFERFDSYENDDAFLPPEGLDFDYLPHKKPKNLTPRQEKFYMPGEPKEFRSKPKPPDSEQKEKHAA